MFGPMTQETRRRRRKINNNNKTMKYYWILPLLWWIIVIIISLSYHQLPPRGQGRKLLQQQQSTNLTCVYVWQFLERKKISFILTYLVYILLTAVSNHPTYLTYYFAMSSVSVFDDVRLRELVVCYHRPYMFHRQYAQSLEHLHGNHQEILWKA